jgi:hypothetical protein
MLLHEVINPNPTLRRLLNDIQFVTDSNENATIEKRLIKKRIKPTLINMKRYLLWCFLTPIQELPLPERKIIQRLVRPDPYE